MVDYEILTIAKVKKMKHDFCLRLLSGICVPFVMGERNGRKFELEI